MFNSGVYNLIIQTTAMHFNNAIKEFHSLLQSSKNYASFSLPCVSARTNDNEQRVGGSMEAVALQDIET